MPLIRHCLTLLFSLSLLTACAKKEEYAAEPASAPAAAADSASRETNFSSLTGGAEGGKQAAPTVRTLAYVHHYDLDLAEDRIAAAYDSLLKACAAQAAGCTVLESSLNTGDNVHAWLKLRAAPAAVKPLVAALGQTGDITNAGTTAEDLSGPLADTAKRIAMLQEYRTSLLDLRARAAHDIDALIKVNQELATVQSELESMSGEQAQLRQRVETEIVEIRLSASGSQSLLKPLGEAFSSFGWHLSQAVAGIVLSLAYILPWGLLVVVVLGVFRRVAKKLRGRG